MEQYLNIIPYVITVLVSVYFIWSAHATGRARAWEHITQLNEVIAAGVRQADSFLDKSDVAKYDYVAQLASDWMKYRGVKIPAYVVRQLIEGAVTLVHRAQSYRPDDEPDHK